MLIAAVSDTHIPGAARALPDALVERLRKVDLILHTGDFTTVSVLSLLNRLAPTEAVCGNVDDLYLRATLPSTRVVKVGGFRIGLVHGDGPGGSTLERARHAFAGVDCIVFGHSHQPYLGRQSTVLMINPGSPTDKRREPQPSFALIRVEATLDAEIVYL